ncbi:MULTISPECIES: hypothetical protein [Campylobacter]|uniref:hypothetical protein n=1 Tax=Campylobacter TaxID=194 RepID=UPI000A34DFF8|nr:hypothetical protein [Campylobacter sp. P0124]MCR8695705.1 hypothetical protein [Campylobacter sp. RM19073]
MAYQEKKWQNFYERAWAIRAEFMSKFISGGGYNALQVISELEKRERHYTLAVNDNGDYEWRKKESQSEKFNFVDIPYYGVTSLNGMTILVPYYTKTSFIDFIIDALSFDEYDSVIELGCGYGRNLFKIFYNGGGINLRYFGGEFTNSGVEMARKLADIEPKMKAEFFHFNHLKPKFDKNLDFGKRVLVFTSHTIEQVKEIPDNWFKSVTSIAPFVRCIHAEPFGFQIQNLGEASKNHKEYFLKNGWNLNFAKTLKKANQNGDIIIEDALLEYSCGTDPFNPTSIAVWRSV